MEGLDKTNVWQASKLITSPLSDASKMRILTLQVRDPITKRITKEAVDNATKGQLFYETFFPPENPTLTTPPDDYRYPPP